jgi:hypothetical protein
MVDMHYTATPKALVVRGPNTPWTFLRYNFSPTESAKNIVLTADAPRKLILSASGADEKEMSQVEFEVFPAYTQKDDQGNPLRRQRLGDFFSGDQNEVKAVLPLGQVALFVHHEGFASDYHIIDTKDADHFHFVLGLGGQMKITVHDKDGKPVPGVNAQWANPAAPLSLTGGTTDKDGVVIHKDLVPGTYDLSVQGFAPQKVVVDEGKVAEVSLTQN